MVLVLRSAFSFLEGTPLTTSMSLSDTIFTRLSTDDALVALVGDHVYPVAPDTDEVDVLPFVAFTTTSRPNLTLQGTHPVAEYTVSVDVVAYHLKPVQDALAAIRSLLTDWSDEEAGVDWCFFQGEAIVQTDEGAAYVGNQQYQVWAA